MIIDSTIASTVVIELVEDLLEETVLPRRFDASEPPGTTVVLPCRRSRPSPRGSADSCVHPRVVRPPS